MGRLSSSTKGVGPRFDIGDWVYGVWRQGYVGKEYTDDNPYYGKITNVYWSYKYGSYEYYLDRGTTNWHECELVKALDPIEDVKEMTVADIEKLVGAKVKIVKGE